MQSNKSVRKSLKPKSAPNVAPYKFAVIYVGMRDKDAAFDWLNRAYNERSYTLAEYLKTDARLDTLRSDPRFAELERKIGLPQ